MSESPRPLPAVGVIGVGNMGAPIARSILRAGFPVTVFDVRAESTVPLADAGATVASSIEELVAGASVISVIVVNEAQVRAVVETIAKAATEDLVVLVHSTVGPNFVSQLADEMRGQGVAVVDAAVAGGIDRAERGDLTVTVGGDEGAVASARPVLEAIARDVFYGGPTGAGVTMKLVLNLLVIGTYTLQLEAVALASAYGLDEDLMMTVIATSPADSRNTRTWGFQDRVRLQQPADGTARVETLMTKDVTSATEAGAARGVEMPVSRSALASLSDKLRARDDALRGASWVAPPRCGGCNQELAAPFRATGRHPECSAPSVS